MKRLMISPSFLSAQRWFFKKRFTKGWTSYFPFFLYFLICLQVWLCSGQGKLLLFLTPCFFFSHMQLKSARPQIHIDSFALFCKLKISHSFDADRNAVLCSPPCSWKQRLSRPAFPLFLYIYLYIFLTHLPDPEKRKKKRQEKSIKSMNGFSSKTRAFKGETERESDGYRGECGGAVFWWRFWE